MPRPGLRHALVGLWLTFPALAAAQTEPLADSPGNGIAILVRVTDRTTLIPVNSARVVLRLVSDGPDAIWEGATRGNGTIVTPTLRLGEYEVTVDMLGFRPVAERVVLDESGDVDLRIELVPEAVALDPIVVAVRRRTRLENQGFYEREASQIGYFLTREEIEARGPFRISDLFYTIPGARVIPARAGQSAALVLLRNQCVPLIVLDGSPITIPIRLDELLNVGDIEAIEVYHGPSAPVQYSPFTTCGTIMVWTRETRLLEGDPLSWKRLVAGATILGLIILLGR